MKANPGGHIPPNEVIGRDGLIQNLWRILEQRSLVLCSERRMGKTCVINKMVAQVPEGKLPIYNYRDLERVHTPLEFVEIVFQDVRNCLSRSKRVTEMMRRLLAKFGNTEFKLDFEEFGGSIKLPDFADPHWKVLLVKVIGDLAEHQKRIVIFFWDEVPLMLDNIKQRNGENEAMELLDTLRWLRQTYSNLRMVLTGSIGLHHIISSFKKTGYSGEPMNDMEIVDLPSLSPVAGRELAQQLLEGENIGMDNPQTNAQAISDAVDSVPYYIHHVVEQIVQRGGMKDMAIVGEIVDTCLRSPDDPWDLCHYRKRIDIYYMPEERSFALILLDILSGASQALTFDDLFNLLKSRMPTENSEMAWDVLILLQRDHYVIRETDGRYRFRFPLIQRWWRLHRGVAA